MPFFITTELLILFGTLRNNAARYLLANRWNEQLPVPGVIPVIIFVVGFYNKERERKVRVIHCLGIALTALFGLAIDLFFQSFAFQ